MRKNYKWELLTGPFRLPEDRINTLKLSSPLVPTYTLDSLDLNCPDYEIRQKIKEQEGRIAA